MRKQWLIGSLCLFLLFTLSACGKDEQGVSEVSAEDLQKSIENKDDYYLLVLNENQDVIEKSKVIEAYEKKLDEEGLDGHVLNMYEPDSKEQAILDELNEQTLDEKGHTPFEYESGFYAVHNGIIESADAYYGEVVDWGSCQGIIEEYGSFLEDYPYQHYVEDIVDRTVEMVDDKI